MNYWRFYRSNQSAIHFGFLMTAASGFGQSYILSLFVPYFMESFSVGAGAFGGYYSTATLLAAASLPLIGKYIDRVSLKAYSLFVLIGLMVACLVTAAAPSIWALLIGLWLMRLFGQSLCTHTSSTSMARYFGPYRGKALSLSGLGFPVAEGVFPMLVAALALSLGWRTTFYGMAVFVVLVYVPLALYFLRQEITVDLGECTPEEKKVHKVRNWTRPEMLSDWRFYVLQPSSIASPFFLTGIILYQLPLAEAKGWDPQWMAASFVGFAIARFIASLIIGPIVDRFTARACYPFFLIPLALGLVGFAFIDHPWMAPLFFACAGFTVGTGGNVKNSLLAELYGVRHLGSIRSLASMLVVVGTALGPLLVGGLLTRGVSVPTILVGLSLTTVAFAVLSIFALVLPPAARFRNTQPATT